MIYIGIDPGAKGGIGIITGCLAYAYTYSDDRMIDIARKFHDRAVFVVEEVWGMPQQSSKATFNFGKEYGLILGILLTFDARMLIVSPRKWKAEFDLVSKPKEGIVRTKQDSIDKCKEIFPSAFLLPTKRSRKESDGMAESLLIAEYGRRYDPERKD